RSYGDWSSDVCSSDLVYRADAAVMAACGWSSTLTFHNSFPVAASTAYMFAAWSPNQAVNPPSVRSPSVMALLIPASTSMCQKMRSEERRVGKGCREWE